ncbi:hypothetical protein ACE6H2_019813 [Prunus campanulata]
MASSQWLFVRLAANVIDTLVHEEGRKRREYEMSEEGTDRFNRASRAPAGVCQRL